MNLRLATLLLPVLGIAGVATAQLTLTGHTFEGGGTSANGPLKLSSIIGQPDPSLQNQGPYSLQGGFFFQGPQQPLWVDIASFVVIDQGDGIGPLVRWTTTLELDNAGFNLRRAVPAGSSSWSVGERLNPSLIAAEGSETFGFTYNFVDPLPYIHGSGPRAYFLEDIDLAGVSSYHGPAVLNITPGRTGIADWRILN